MTTIFVFFIEFVCAQVDWAPCGSRYCCASSLVSALTRRPNDGGAEANHNFYAGG